MSVQADRTARRCAKFFLLLRERQDRLLRDKPRPLRFCPPAGLYRPAEKEFCPADRGLPRADLAHKISEVTAGQVYPVVLWCLSIWLHGKYYPFQSPLIWCSTTF